jgi:hypothetical protein
MPHPSPFARLPWPHLNTARRFGAGLVAGLALVAGDKIFAETTDNGAITPDNPAVATTSQPSNPERQAALATWQAARFGLFLHWGDYSVYGGNYHGKDLWSAEWIQENARIRLGVTVWTWTLNDSARRSSAAAICF